MLYEKLPIGPGDDIKLVKLNLNGGLTELTLTPSPDFNINQPRTSSGGSRGGSLGSNEPPFLLDTN